MKHVARPRLIAVIGLFVASVALGLAIRPATSAAQENSCAAKLTECLAAAEIRNFCRLGPPSPATRACQNSFETAVRGCHKNSYICNTLAQRGKAAPKRAR